MSSDQLFASFVREAEELFDDLDSGLLELEQGRDDPDLVDRLFRSAHTLKGNAGMVGFNDAVQLTHVLENVLDRLRSRTLAVSPEVLEPLFRGVDVLRAMTSSFCAGQTVERSEHYDELVLELARLGGKEEEALAPMIARTLDVRLYYQASAWQGDEDLASLLEELSLIGELSEVETLFDRVVPLDQPILEAARLGLRVLLRTTQGPMAVMGVCFLSVEEEDLIITDVTDGKNEVYSLDAAANEKAEERKQQPGLKLPPSAGKQNASAAGPDASTVARATPTSTLRVETVKLDSLVDLVGELVIGISQVRQPGQQNEADQVAAIERLEGLGRELQEQVMALRMVPVQETFERFRRPLRDLSKELNKQIDFQIEGGETQIDKRMVDSLVDPLKHMLRNSVSHGLEDTDERSTSDKPEVGTIRLSATQREGAVVIEIADDGRGIDASKIRRKAEERGLVLPEQELTEAQCLDLIFLPGFSTAEEVSEISGRGVGMDVVRRSIQALRGSVEIATQLGQGTTFRIRLPLTLAIVDGMNVRVGSENVTIPVRSVVELIALESVSIQRTEGTRQYVDVRDQLLPILNLDEFLGLEKSDIKTDQRHIVVVETEKRRFGLVVDAVLGMSQAVIKPLDQSYQLVERMEEAFFRPRSISGAAILGDGNVGIILDVHGLESSVFEAA